MNPEDVKAQLRAAGVHVWVSPLTSTRTDMTARGLQVRRPRPVPPAATSGSCAGLSGAPMLRHLALPPLSQ